jgi:hypothetical protein
VHQGAERFSEGGEEVMRGCWRVSFKGPLKSLWKPPLKKVCKLYKVCKLDNACRVHQGAERFSEGGEEVMRGCWRVSFKGPLKSLWKPPLKKVCKLYKVCKLDNACRVHQGAERFSEGGEEVMRGCWRVSFKGPLKSLWKPPLKKVCKLYKVCKLDNACRVHQGAERFSEGGEEVMRGCWRVSFKGPLKSLWKPPLNKVCKLYKVCKLDNACRVLQGAERFSEGGEEVMGRCWRVSFGAPLKSLWKPPLEKMVQSLQSMHPACIVEFAYFVEFAYLFREEVSTHTLKAL